MQILVNLYFYLCNACDIFLKTSFVVMWYSLFSKIWCPAMMTDFSTGMNPIFLPCVTPGWWLYPNKLRQSCLLSLVVGHVLGECFSGWLLLFIKLVGTYWCWEFCFSAKFHRNWSMNSQVTGVEWYMHNTIMEALFS